MPFTLTPLPFGTSDLEPVMSKRTLEFHHDNHHAGYVKKLNQLTEGTSFADMKLEAVIKARNVAYAAAQTAAANPADAGAMKNLLGAESGLAGAMSRLMVVSEQYPDLKANQNMMQLTEEMTSTENKISFARQAYNDSVMGYNTTRESFPTNILAGMFNFAEAQLFQIEDATERAAPKVSFS